MNQVILLKSEVKQFFNTPQIFHKSNVGYQKRFQSQNKTVFSKQYFEKLNVSAKRYMEFKPKEPNFPNPSSKQKSKASYVKGKTDVKNISHWLEGKGKSFQPGKFSQEQIKHAYEKYLNESSNGSSSSKESNPSFRQ